MQIINVNHKTKGENTTKLNQGINQGLTKLREKGYGIRNVNVNGAIVVTKGDANEVIKYLQTQPAIKKFTDMEIN